MQKWEYLEVMPSGFITMRWGGEKDFVSFLNKKGEEGWQLVKSPSYQYSNCIFKRPKQ